MKPRLRFTGLPPEAIGAIADLFATEPQRQLFELPNDREGVWQLQHRSESGNIRLLLWPAIDRIDVAVGPHMWVVKGVREVELIEDLELIARFGPGPVPCGVLTVALNGRIVLTTPGDASDDAQHHASADAQHYASDDAQDEDSNEADEAMHDA